MCSLVLVVGWGGVINGCKGLLKFQKQMCFIRFGGGMGWGGVGWGGVGWLGASRKLFVILVLLLAILPSIRLIVWRVGIMFLS